MAESDSLRGQMGQSRLISLGLVAPALLVLLALFVYPLGFSLVTAFVAFPISRCLQDEAGLAGVAPRRCPRLGHARGIRFRPIDCRADVRYSHPTAAEWMVKHVR